MTAIAARRYVSLVKLEHTVFALPMAYAAMLLALDARAHHPSAALALWITAAMVGARTLAMALNRLIDRNIDARNPRTASRELPSGTLSVAQVVGLCALALALLLVATTQLAPITRWLWPIPVALFVLYPYTKRFTWGCHWVLGCCNGLAPVGAWLATTGSLEWTPVLLGLSNLCWVSGFDVIYATGDVDFDRANKLHSLPARFGIPAALRTTRVLHTLTFAFLVGVGLAAGLAWPYFVGVALVGGLLAYENAIVSPDDLSRVNAAFFTTNGVIGLIYLTSVIAGLTLG